MIIRCAGYDRKPAANLSGSAGCGIPEREKCASVGLFTTTNFSVRLECTNSMNG